MNQARPYVTEIARSFPCSCATLFRLWTVEAELLRWSELESCKLDVRSGGSYEWRFSGEDVDTTGVFTEVDPPHRLAFTWDGVSPGGPSRETLVVIRFQGDGGRCELHIRHECMHEYTAIECKEGWAYWLKCLAEFVQTSDAV